MHFLRRTLIALSIVFAAAGWAMPLTARAQSQASVLFSNWDITRIDLTPDDGIEAGIGFYGSTVTVQASFYDAPDGTGTPRDAVSESATFGTVNFSINNPGTIMYGEFTGSTGNAAVYVEQGLGSVTTDASNTFVLAPYSQITFTLYANVSELNGPGGDASASFALTGRLQAPDGSVVDYTSAISSNDPPPTGLVALTLTSGAEQIYGQLHFTSALSARVTPVPEPAALSLLAAGLGIIGVTARRRRRAFRGNPDVGRTGCCAPMATEMMHKRKMP
jgi:hypothetical protein